MYTTELEQDITLFFKLYLLSHHISYINYMEKARILARWFDFSKHKEVDINVEGTIYCASCFRKIGKIKHRGTFTIGCGECGSSENISYEISKLGEITGMKWDYTTYFLCKAIDDMYRSNSQDVLYQLIKR